jgi:hypothetical protein
MSLKEQMKHFSGDISREEYLNLEEGVVSHFAATIALLSALLGGAPNGVNPHQLRVAKNTISQSMKNREFKTSQVNRVVGDLSKAFDDNGKVVDQHAFKDLQSAIKEYRLKDLFKPMETDGDKEIK